MNLLNLKINTNKKRTINKKNRAHSKKKLIRALIESLTNTKKYENFISKKLNFNIFGGGGGREKRGGERNTRTSFLK